MLILYLKNRFTDVPNAPTQDDFGYNPETFPKPKAQLTSYHDDLHVKFGGIRKPRIANASVLAEVNASSWLLEGAANNLNFSIGAVRQWYVHVKICCLSWHIHAAIDRSLSL